jgi:hypothetical protein
MRRIFENGKTIFSCSPLPKHTAKLWTDFYSCFQLLINPPPKGQTRTQVASSFSLQFQEWKTFFHEEGHIFPEWRIYFHILECHASSLYERLGNLHPWANEAGEHLHALDRMFFFQRSRKGIQQLATKVLKTGWRVRASHHSSGVYQTPDAIPSSLKVSKPLMNQTPVVHFCKPL